MADHRVPERIEGEGDRHKFKQALIYALCVDVAYTDHTEESDPEINETGTIAIEWEGFEYELDLVGVRKMGSLACDWRLYWVWTDDGAEDCMVVALSEHQAREFFEQSEGYDLGDAIAELVYQLDQTAFEYWEAERVYAHKEDPKLTVEPSPTYASTGLMEACGAKVVPLTLGKAEAALSRRLGCQEFTIELGGETYTAGNLGVILAAREVFAGGLT